VEIKSYQHSYSKHNVLRTSNGRHNSMWRLSLTKADIKCVCILRIPNIMKMHNFEDVLGNVNCFNRIAAEVMQINNI
jgi:hypothetical protein